METDRSPDQLYSEAKELLALVDSESPSSTGPRRPPRSKHDTNCGLEEVVPSAEAHHRLLIGTVMLSKHGGGGVARSQGQDLRLERAGVLTEVGRL